MSAPSCSPFDLKDYFYRELADPQRLQVETHIRVCAACREELDRLGQTEHALFALRDEEIPQRIGFVSDPVFEPSPWRRALASFWNSGPRLGFASAAMLSAALVVFALVRPAPAPVVRVAAAGAPPAVVTAPAVSEAAIQARIDAAVAKAVAPMEVRHEAEMRQVKADLEGARQRLILAAEEYDYNHKKEASAMISAGLYAPPQHGTGEIR
ncbi:MAG TPA: hypothetical protein VKX45_21090 [Bryobacteraceae bacterium]|nr:hypothetical protein [Bryobacteraceae bacterium]